MQDAGTDDRVGEDETFAGATGAFGPPVELPQAATAGR